MVGYHIAQINSALARSEMTVDIMSGFVDRLEEEGPSALSFTFSKSYRQPK